MKTESCHESNLGVTRVIVSLLTHWGRVTHTWAIKSTIIDSDNTLSPGLRQAIIWNKDEIVLFQTYGTNVSEILSEINIFSFKKMHLKMSSANGRFVFERGPGIGEVTWKIYYHWSIILER